MSELPSLKIGAKKLAQVTELSVPAVTQPLLNINIEQNEQAISADLRALWQRGAAIPTAFGPLVCARVLHNACVSCSDTGRIGKTKWELELALIGEDKSREGGGGGVGDAKLREQLLANCDAGDSFNVLFENPEDEVHFVLQRLGLSGEMADTEHRLEVRRQLPESDAKLAHLPSHCSPRQLLSQFVDIRRAPSRLALRVFADHADDAGERRRLLELCSAQGASNLQNLFDSPTFHWLKFCANFRHFHLQCLPRLLPRHYTLACNLAAQHETIRFRFVYSVLELPAPVLDGCAEFAGKKRYGACSQWLLRLTPGQTVQLVQKEPSKFRFLPPSLVSAMSSSAAASAADDHHLLLNTPLMMVGPGTGVAPFIAFLQKIRHCIQRMGGGGANCERNRMKRVLFYASSNLEDEFLFSELVLCESRPGAASSLRRPARVYNALRERSAEVADFLTESDGLFYACGDVKNMSRELWMCLRDILQSHKGFSPVESIEWLKKLREQERLIEDVWS
ncbi:FAD binding domain [Globodera pallida]|nr:FAD binding domain [Globodera pallida]